MSPVPCVPPWEGAIIYAIDGRCYPNKTPCVELPAATCPTTAKSCGEQETCQSAPPSIITESAQGYQMLYGMGPEDKPVPIRVDKDGRVILAPKERK